MFVINFGDWEQRKLGDVADILAGGDVDKSKLSAQGKYPVFANALTNNGIFGYYEDSYRIESPAVTVTGRGDVGHAKARKVNFTPVVRLLSVKSKHDVDFLEHAINSHKVLIESTGVPQLTSPQLSNYKIWFTSTSEERKIGSFFKQLDDTIALHQEKLVKLNQLKKGYLQVMFPQKEEKAPRLRFAHFSLDWEQRKLGKELSLLKDGTHGTHTDVKDGLYLLSAKNIKNGKVNITETDRKISKEEFTKIHQNFSLQPRDILLTVVGSIGETAILKETLNVTFQRSVAYLRPSSLNYQFLYTIVSGETFQKELKKRQVVSAQPGIYLGDLAKIDIIIALDINEQKQIGSFFKLLDDNIALHHDKLEKLKKIKNIYLQKLFV